MFDRFISGPGPGKLNRVERTYFLPWNRKQAVRILNLDRRHFFEDVISSLMATNPPSLDETRFPVDLEVYNALDSCVLTPQRTQRFHVQ